ncbi:hypothetical protein GCM10010919_08480 [Alishewanella longhuensis]|uniref:DUF4268 domain-containing protein n=1 Tax=Alishewanella longhuensis TaxID=1091037 RepID=A0ABQ3KVN9_9ALTE|nr:hypothetical protein [Alishewanella longhuensis]GHG63091.1 hypothetical protein GCM10010919_08480 [Alishewanella longhuensis]
MAISMSEQAILTGSGQTWQHWLTLLEQQQAAAWSHKEIAAFLAQQQASHWWAQMLAVQYEQHIGRRVLGQDCSGSFSVSVNKTLPGNMDEALNRWQQLVKDEQHFADITLSRGPDISHTEKWRYWRCGLADGSRVNINIYQKSPDKAALSVQHEKLETEVQVEFWRSYWKARLANI